MKKTPDTGQRDAFVQGRVERLRLGGYGGTVHLERVSAGVRVRLTSPRRQEVIGPDDEGTRRAALLIADQILGTVQEEKARPMAPRVRRIASDGRVLITGLDIWRAYLEQWVGVMPEGMLSWPRSRLASYWSSLTPAERRTLPSIDYVSSVLLAARHFDEAGVLSFSASVDDLQSGHLTAHMRTMVTQGYSANTMKTYLGRLRSAIRYFRTQWAQDWAGRPDPTTRAKAPPTHKVDSPPEIGEERAMILLQHLRKAGEWRAWAAAVIALEAGRRIGAIGARRVGTQLDDVPLAATDFRRTPSGRMEVVWRAGPSKGHAYGRGDEVQPCTRRLEVVYRWLRRHHPNPRGGAYPLIWDPDDPTRGASYDSLGRAFDVGWRQAFGEPRPKGLRWHSIIRTTVTTIADASDIGAAAEFTGRTVESARRFYKKVRPARQRQTVELLDRTRS